MPLSARNSYGTLSPKWGRDERASRSRPGSAPESRTRAKSAKPFCTGLETRQYSIPFGRLPFVISSATPRDGSACACIIEMPAHAEKAVSMRASFLDIY